MLRGQRGPQVDGQYFNLSLEHPPRDPQWHHPYLEALSISPQSVIIEQARALAHLHWVEHLDAHRVNCVIRCLQPSSLHDESDSCSDSSLVSTPPPPPPSLIAAAANADLWVTNLHRARPICDMYTNFATMAFLAFVADEDDDETEPWSCPWPKPIGASGWNDWVIFAREYLCCSRDLRVETGDGEDVDDGLPKEFLDEVMRYYWRKTGLWGSDDDDDAGDDENIKWRLLDEEDQLWYKPKLEG